MRNADLQRTNPTEPPMNGRLRIIALAPFEIVFVSLHGLVQGFRSSIFNIRDAWRDAGRLALSDKDRE